MDQFAGTSVGDSVRRAVAAGREAFGADWSADRVAIAPGRIELLGNHVDYSGGPVLAAAIDRFVVVAARDEPKQLAVLRGVAADAPGIGVTTIDANTINDWRNPAPPPQTFDYARGLLAGLLARPGLRGRVPATIAIAGDVPIGFGVSSSAALCVSLTLALADGFAGSEEIVLLAQEAEHRAGTPCGTLDQSASVAGGVIAFDSATLGVERLRPSLGDLVFAVVDSGVDRSLGASSYPRRVEESQDALERARRELAADIPFLAALTLDQLHELEQRRTLPDPLPQRVQHIVEETARVHAGREAMRAGDWVAFGRLMSESGRSSATLYEISHPRVEEMVAEALTVDGVLGARMMGGGEGGSALMLLPRAAVADLQGHLISGYFGRHGMAGREGLIHTCAFASGAAVIPSSGRSLAELV